ncbi:hypothetical protein C2G38_2217765 [Gigaspora rosea]|uniref:Uncharacterized protein n=1 Tax=Gigaspora rosea TaxID=44941 RepID=A0A397UAQ3_9GLOM|nr:hypothetical protein C2G38_2217765 [Gigaspora rosea]
MTWVIRVIWSFKVCRDLVQSNNSGLNVDPSHDGAPTNNDKELATTLANYVPDTKNKRAKVNISKLRYDDTKNWQPPFNT